MAYGIAFASHQEIDEINILQATFLAMRRAVEQLGGPAGAGARRWEPRSAAWHPDADNRERRRAVSLDCGGVDPREGDAGSLDGGAGREVSAVRLRRSKGYGTKRHYAALTEFGPCEEHRQTFLRKFYEKA